MRRIAQVMENVTHDEQVAATVPETGGRFHRSRYLDGDAPARPLRAPEVFIPTQAAHTLRARVEDATPASLAAPVSGAPAALDMLPVSVVNELAHLAHEVVASRNALSAEQTLTKQLTIALAQSQASLQQAQSVVHEARSIAQTLATRMRERDGQHMRVQAEYDALLRAHADLSAQYELSQSMLEEFLAAPRLTRWWRKLRG